MKTTIHRSSIWRLCSFGVFTAAITVLSLCNRAQAQQTMGWSFYDGGSFGKSGGATNGSVFDSSSEIGGGDTTLGSISGNVGTSEVYIYHSGSMQTYGAYTQFGSTLHLWAYNHPGETGAISVTVMPYVAVSDYYVTPSSLNSVAQVDFSLTTRKNGNDWDKRQYSVMFNGIVGGKGITIGADVMEGYTMSFSDADEVQFAMSHMVTCLNQWWMTEWVRSVGWYSVVVSNGYLSTGPRLPVDPPLPISPVLRPGIASASFNGDHTQVTINGNGGPTNAPLSFCVLTSTELSVPAENWTPCLTNQFTTNGTFSFSMPVNAGEPQRFIRMRVNPH